MQRMGSRMGPWHALAPNEGHGSTGVMLIAIAVIVLALAAVTIAWGRRIDAEVTGRIEAHRPSVRRPA
jgi:hypothetical protein